MDDITLPNGCFIPVISEFRSLWSYITTCTVDTDIHDAGVWRLWPPRSGTLTGSAILRPSSGKCRVLGVAQVWRRPL
jgi:hypothetical protein